MCERGRASEEHAGFQPVAGAGAGSGGAGAKGAEAAGGDARGQAVGAGALRADARCGNCGRPAYIHGMSTAVRDGDAVFCSRNCLWSVVVDPAGFRLRAARRRKAAAAKGGRGRRRRARREEAEAEAEAEESEEEGGGEERRGQFRHAMFCYHDAMKALQQPVRAASRKGQIGR